MLKQFSSFLNFLLYSNIFIALCAVALCLETMSLLDAVWDYWLLGEVFAATVCIYALHRLVSLGKLRRQELLNERFRRTGRLEKVLWGLLIINGLLGMVCYWFLATATQLAIFLPALLSLGYVFPSIRQMRLRDLHFVKIFLIALVWAYVTVLLPWLEMGKALEDVGWVLYFLERALFIFVITIPFDIRDEAIERHNGVQTIPSLLGQRGAKRLALLTLLVWSLLCWQSYETAVLLALLGVAVFVGLLVLLSSPKRSDYFYTGLLDGTMLLRGGAVLLVNFYG